MTTKLFNDEIDFMEYIKQKIEDEHIKIEIIEDEMIFSITDGHELKACFRYW